MVSLNVIQTKLEILYVSPFFIKHSLLRKLRLFVQTSGTHKVIKSVYLCITNYLKNMIKSMTGYGRIQVESEKANITIEVKTLNSKQLDINCRIPASYKENELEIRNLINTKLRRGKVDCFINIEVTTENEAPEINTELVEYYYKQIKSLSNKLKLDSTDDVLGDILRFPDIFKTQNGELDQETWKKTKEGLMNAIDLVDEFRITEGKVLEADFILRINNILSLLERIAPFESERINNIKARIKTNLNRQEEIDVDENRFEQELIFYMEKLDITEEKIRLNKHCEYFLETIGAELSSGKKLIFIAQEIGREINTIGAKANDADIQRIVVLMKDELEKIKEQLFNIL